MAENTTRGFGTLPCPKCGEQDCTITLSLEDGTSCFCTNCEEEFDLEDVRHLIAAWAEVLDRLDRMFAK